jgi:ABC-type uncharacterized transport system ATPase subunit
MTCDRVSIIDRGETKRTGRLEDILTETTRGVSVVVAGLAPDRVARVQSEHRGATVADGAIQLDFDDVERARAYIGDVLATGGKLVRFEQHRDDLETIFLRSLQDPNEARKEGKA